MVTAPGSGAEIIPFLKTWVNLPMAIGFTVLYAQVRAGAEWPGGDAAAARGNVQARARTSARPGRRGDVQLCKGTAAATGARQCMRSSKTLAGL